MKPEQIVNLLKIAEELPHLESRYEIIRGNILALKRLEENLENELYQLNIYKEISSNQLELLRAEENRLRHLIDRLENADEYDKINKLVQKRVREILDNKKLIIGIALSVLIMSIRNEPDRR